MYGHMWQITWSESWERMPATMLHLAKLSWSLLVKWASSCYTCSLERTKASVLMCWAWYTWSSVWLPGTYGYCTNITMQLAWLVGIMKDLYFFARVWDWSRTSIYVACILVASQQTTIHHTKLSVQMFILIIPTYSCKSPALALVYIIFTAMGQLHMANNVPVLCSIGRTGVTAYKKHAFLCWCIYT